MQHTYFMAWSLGPMEIGIILVVALLIFGKRLPEVGKSFGKSIVEFKKGISGIEDDVNDSVNQSNQYNRKPPREPRQIDHSAQENLNEETEKQKENDHA